MQIFTNLILSTAILILVREASSEDCNANEQTVADSFAHYSAWTRPRLNASTPLEVSLQLFVFALSSVDDLQQTATLLVEMRMAWFDEFRTWNTTSSLACVPFIVIPNDKTWLPDIALPNTVQKYALYGSNERLRLFSNGQTIYSPSEFLTVNCIFDFGDFPFDQQNCTMELSSWKYEHSVIHLTYAEPPVNVLLTDQNLAWELLSVTIGGGNAASPKGSAISPGVYDGALYSIAIKRKSTYYVINVILPSIGFAVIKVASFFLPLGDGNKIYTSLTCMLVFTAYQLMIQPFIPPTSDSIPMLSKFLNLQMLFIGFSIIGEGLVITIFHRGVGQTPFASYYVWITTTIIGAIVMLPYRSNVSITEPQAEDNSSKWHYMAMVLERVVEIVYTSCVLLSTVLLITFAYEDDQGLANRPQVLTYRP